MFQVLRKSGAQPIIIGKNLAQQLGLRANNPCLYSIVSLIGGNKYVISQIKASLHLIIGVGDEPTNVHISLKFENLRLTNYHILFSNKSNILLILGWTTRFTKFGYIHDGPQMMDMNLYLLHLLP